MDDLIRRSDAIRVASGYCHWTNIPDELAKLPSVNPIPCEDAISRQAAIAAVRWGKSYISIKNPDGSIFEENICENENEELEKAAKRIQKLPSVTTVPKKGSWKKVPGMNEQCDQCGKYFPLSYFYDRPFEINYCPSCGAKMGVEE